MHKILTLNQISVKGLERLPRDHYEIASEFTHPEAILLRSHKLQPEDIPESVLGIARAGAGVNNIPVAACTERGIPVFNTPGANANAVKELIIAALCLGSRGILQGVQYVDTLKDMTDKAEMNTLLEKEKKNYKGNELAGKTLGVVGLGAIGSMVADAALELGMTVKGYDPALSVESAWRLSSNVERVENLNSLFSKCDYITLHLPVLDATRGLINRELLASCKKDLRLLNFARAEIVDTAAVISALNDGDLGQYIADFPEPGLIGVPNTILTPHIGASTDEAEDNCAVMAADQIKDFIENGNIKNSVNFPTIAMERADCPRLAIANRNIPKMLGNILSLLADEDINVVDMINKSRDDIAYNLIDVAQVPCDEVLKKILDVEGVITVRVLN
ncbi:phosphoglycerate dehydrogenase [Dasania sp. GY-MA-18]|uniref:D-3-phosphoglycerate dehydrogenase n=1 Tax=Dasania phycosphaerae TaxID=2950436 RepID=A0A9J6RIR2_9GAMM|nr:MULTISPECIES: phosphoglycerate dehydrogenase [Dasania]MCR8921927.1 phosphoglycerate dehydrogenase [Dasania sp. GY-MA-18]MCZ0864355.1 phosphoglycerate dehydrogenase [Dasania phycosphaerae]MCZ0868083.1 phosphoglycerate dehydrogenase [Dasania phycosphaerae]